MSEMLPKGWNTTELENLCSIRTGKLDVNAGNPNGKYFFFTCAQEIYRIDKYAFEGKAILVAGNGFFNAKYYDGKFNAYQRTYVLQNFPINERYLFFYISYSLDLITKENRGSTIKYIRLGDLANHPVTLPPLNEQKRIVAKLDKIMPRIDSVKARLDRVPTIIKRFRQSVLTAAITGKLTEKWREEHSEVESADNLALGILPNKLKDSYLNVFEETQYSDLPTNWVYAPLVNLGKIQGGGTPSKSNLNYWKGNIPWISPKDMKVDRISSGRYFISKKALDSSSANLIPQKSILFVIRGMILAHTFPVAITQNEVTINQDMKGITPCSAINPEYLFLVFKSIQGNVLSYIREATHGTLRLANAFITNFCFPHPAHRRAKRNNPPSRQTLRPCRQT